MITMILGDCELCDLDLNDFANFGEIGSSSLKHVLLQAEEGALLGTEALTGKNYLQVF